MPLRNIAEQILSIAAAFGAGSAEVFIRSSSATAVEIKQQQVDAFERSRDTGVGLRVFSKGRSGFSFSTDLARESLEQMVQAALASAASTDPDPFRRLPETPRQSFPSVVIHDPSVTSLTEHEQIDLARELEGAAFAADPRIKRARKAVARFANRETMIGTSGGIVASYESTSVSASIEVVAEEAGESQAGWDFDVKRSLGRISMAGVGQRAARRAVEMLGARRIGSVRSPVLLDPRVAVDFIALLASAVSAEQVQKKKSLLAGRIGVEIISPLITLMDDGLLDGGMGTAPCDDEAVPQSAKTVIDNGVLLVYLQNGYTAAKDGVQSTGNGMRPGYAGIPGVGVTNFHVAPGTQRLDELVRSMDRGLYVTEVMGAHTANPVSGDFSVGAMGFWIEKGRIAYPVREITISGTLLEMLKNVDAVGSDIRFFGRIGSPPLLVKELSISGN